MISSLVEKSNVLFTPQDCLQHIKQLCSWYLSKVIIALIQEVFEDVCEVDDNILDTLGQVSNPELDSYSDKDSDDNVD